MEIQENMPYSGENDATEKLYSMAEYNFHTCVSIER